MTRPGLEALREWTEHCRAVDHRACQHIGSAGTVGLRGARAYVTICTCPCHGTCPAADSPLAQMKADCICLDDREARQHQADADGVVGPVTLLDRIVKTLRR